MSPIAPYAKEHQDTNGVDVYLTGRGVGKSGKKAEAELRYDNKPGKLEYIEMDLDSLGSIRKFATDFLSRTEGKLDILICNAGKLRKLWAFHATLFRLKVSAGIRKERLKMALSYTLEPTTSAILLASSTPSFHSRVVCLSTSATASPASVDRPDEYQPLLVYAQSNKHLHGIRDRKALRLECHVDVCRFLTRLNRMTPESELNALTGDPLIAKNIKNVEQGAATTASAAISHEWEGKGRCVLGELPGERAAEW